MNKEIIMARRIANLENTMRKMLEQIAYEDGGHLVLLKLLKEFKATRQSLRKQFDELSDEEIRK